MNIASEDASGGIRLSEVGHSDPELLTILLDGSPDGLCLLTTSGAILAVNRAAREVLGDVDGEPDGGLRMAGPADRALVERAVHTCEPAHRTERLADGRRLLFTARPVVSPRGAVTFVVLTVRDAGLLASALAPLGFGQGAAGATWPEAGLLPSRERQGTQLIARSAVMVDARDLARQYAGVDSPVLLLGERGTGKRTLASLIHAGSARREGPFMEVSCAAMPEALLDAELFGQVQRPGHAAGKVGLLELAHRGTLLMKEVGSLPLNLQAKLLRFLDDGEVWPCGATEPRRPDPRILAASSHDLGRLVAEGAFRADLYYRLNGLTLSLPPLREHREDVAPLVEMMLAELGRTTGRARTIAPAALDAIGRGPFPGNVRELWQLVEQIVSGTAGELIGMENLPLQIRTPGGIPAAAERRVSMRRTLREIEAQMVRDALVRYGTQTEAAKHLGVTQSTVARKAKQYGLGRMAI